MLKTKVISLCILATATAGTAFADNIKALNGLHMGVSAGYVFGKSNVRVANRNGTDSGDLANTGGLGGLNVGYSLITNQRFVVGVEFAGNISSAKGSYYNRFDPNSNFSVQLKQKTSFTGAIKLGGIFGGVAAYVKVGGAATKFSASHWNSFLARTATSNALRTGVLYGVGVDIPFAQRFTIGGEFYRVDYKSLIFNNGTSVSISVKPHVNTFTLNLKIKIK